jgi:hypothetical protein
MGKDEEYKGNTGMDRRSFLAASSASAACFLSSTQVLAAAEYPGKSKPGRRRFRRLKLYQPSLRVSPVQLFRPPWAPKWGYNHDSDIVYFKGRYVCGWNGNEQSDYESKLGQYNYIRLSEDFENWSDPVKAFMREGGAVNPVEQPRQWQPNFLNYKNEILFCNWKSDNKQDYFAGDNFRHWISTSTDGRHWVNHRQPSHPPDMPDVRSFPTTHGLLTSRGVMLFPVSLRAKSFSSTRYGAAFRSEDQGKTWHFGQPFGSIPVSELGLSPEDFGGEDFFSLWEPTFFEHSDGSIGCLIRNLRKKFTVKRDGKQERVRSPLSPEHAIFYCVSHDQGKTFSTARPIEVDSVSSRELAIGRISKAGGMLMCANDWVSDIPKYVHDRHYLSMFAAPVDDPDLLLPGPLVQRIGGNAHYPNGYVDDDKLTISYSHGTSSVRSIYASQLEPLPDFSQPFLMLRGRLPQAIIKDRIAFFHDAACGMGLVLNRELTEVDTLKLSFAANIEVLGGKKELPLLTIGGKTRNGCLLTVDVNSVLRVRMPDKVIQVGKVDLHRWVRYELFLGRKAFSLSVEGLEKKVIESRLLRKIFFGELYHTPLNHPSVTAFYVDCDSIEVTASPKSL